LPDEDVDEEEEKRHQYNLQRRKALEMGQGEAIQGNFFDMIITESQLWPS